MSNRIILSELRSLRLFSKIPVIFSILFIFLIQTSAFAPMYHGIDGIFKKGGKWVIVEAKGGNAGLNMTKYGQQMSQKWIQHSLEMAVKNGDDVSKEIAEKVLKAIKNDPKSVETLIVKTKIINDVVQDPTIYQKAWSAVQTTTW